MTEEPENKLSPENEELLDKLAMVFTDLGPFFDQLQKERTEMRSLIQRENPDRAKVLNYHLIIENMVD